MSAPTLITFAVYLAGMLALGVVAYRMTGDLSDYILGGRGLGPGVSALSAGASDMSGWLLLGLPGALYVDGMNQIWIAIGLSFGAWFNWQFVAARLRRYTEVARDSLTLPDYFENRFHDASRLLRVISAVVILLFFTIYTSAGLVGGAVLFEQSFGFSYSTALWTGALVIISYTFLGGYLAVCWTDFIQGILMFLALVAVPVVAIFDLGGWRATVNAVGAIDPGRLDAFTGTTGLGIVSLMAWGLGYFGQPHILARFMGIRSSDDVPAARLIGMSWMVASLFGAIFTGFVAIAWFRDRPLDNAETAFIQLTQLLFNPWIAGILLAAILAAIMSTVDSQLLVSSSTLTEDFYKAFLRRSAGERELVWVGRFAVLLIALIAVLLARNPESTVLGLVSYAWAGFGAAFGPVVLLSLLWRRMTRNGALAGIVAGTVTMLVWAELDGGVFDLYEILPGFVANLAAIVAVSLAGATPAPAIEAEFDRV
ncbi:MAG TPA: sodium/proline symporter PutP [Arenibaculum sp.]|nr:sodium/proline symporter PutP [Arenibaculum sp.]